MPTQHPPHHVLIRPIQTADWPIVRAMTIQMLTDAPHAFGETLPEAQARTSEEWTQWAGHFADMTQARAFVAEDEVGACGFVCVDAADPRPPQGTALVSRLWVAQHQRGTGLGKALMEAATQWAVAHGADQIALGVTEVNQEVLKFYQHLGYSDTGLRAPWPADPSKNIIILGRQLRP
jgi:ribosomal protein S18 acetylase RimI-like enzyme